MRTVQSRIVYISLDLIAGYIIKDDLGTIIHFFSSLDLIKSNTFNWIIFEIDILSWDSLQNPISGNSFTLLGSGEQIEIEICK